MSKLTAPRSGAKRDIEHTVDVLATLFFVAFSVGALYFGRDILVPIAIAVLLSFVLSQPIMLLRRLGLNRVLAVAVVVVASLFITVAVSAAMTRQLSDLAADLPRYQATINAKISRLRDMVSANVIVEKGAAALKSIGKLDVAGPKPNAGPRAPAEPEAAGQPVPVEVREPPPSPFKVVQTIVGTALSPIETTGIVVVFVIFILLQREDLRNRFIRLVGSNDLQRTTVAMNDAAGRLSRFFLAQTLVNSGFGMLAALGLHMIGVPSPILFGIIAFLMRFVPYVGAIIAASFPIALAAAVDPGWTMAIETLALFVTLELVIGNLVEPFLYGHNTGLSPLAVVVSATFWTWLWGPVGLVLSTPLTVCLVVLGRHVDQLEFLDVILGDAPALSPAEHFYQRMLVSDAAEVADQAERFLQGNALIAYYDEVAIRGLLMAEADFRGGLLPEHRQKDIRDTIEEVIEDLSDHVDVAQKPAEPEEAKPFGIEDADERTLAPEAVPETAPTAAPGSRKPVLCIAGRNFLDEAAAALLAQMLQKHGLDARVESASLLTVAGVPNLAGAGEQIICLSYLGEDIGAARVRFAVRRLRRRRPEAKILAAFWGLEASAAKELCAQAKADFCATRLADAVSFCVGEAKAAAGKAAADGAGEDASGNRPPAPALAGVA